MTLCNTTHFHRNKSFAENADCHNWNTAHNIIASEIINYDFQNQLVFSLDLFIWPVLKYNSSFLRNGSFNITYSAASMVIYYVFFSCLATMKVAIGQTFDRMF